MNGLEKIIYNKVKNNPQLKQRIVDMYQLIMSIFPQKPFITTPPYYAREGYFYGFHDKSPFSPDGEKLLAHKNIIGNNLVKANDEVEVGYFVGQNWTEFIHVDKSASWNWQLGSMLQWCGKSNTKFAYNKLNRDKHVSIIYNIENSQSIEYDWPIVHISGDQKYACSYDFSRVEYAMPGYGYVSTHKEYTEYDSSFCVFNLADGKLKFKISLTQIVSIDPHSSMNLAFHFFHHALFNPSSTRILFLHRWIDINGRRWTRMFSVDVDGSNLYLFPMDEMVSHITWASENEIFGYLRYPNDGEGYYLIEDLNGRYFRLFEDIISSDGHPTMDKCRGYVITDTYPDRVRNQYLILALLDSGKRIDLCRTHLPKLFTRELQVDLHPRLHPFLHITCFDSGHQGNRSLLTLDFSKYCT